jgi:hypothetical protein
MSPAASWIPDKNNPVPSYIGRISKQVGFLVERKRYTDIDTMADLQTILSKLGSIDRYGHPSLRYIL